MLPINQPNPSPVLRDVRLASIALNQINISWYYDGDIDTSSLIFLIYLNDRLVQRVGGEVREVTIFSPGTGLHDVEVVPWRADLRYPYTIYGASSFRKLHIDFIPDSTPLSVDAYQIFKLDTGSSTAELFESKESIAADIGWHRFSGSGVWAEVLGSFSDSEFSTNSSVTVEYVASRDQLKVTCPNDAGSSFVFFNDNEIVEFYRGLSIRISGKDSLQDGDSFTVILGILPYYDTPALPDGEHTFYVSTLNKNGNSGPLSDPATININNPPEPPQASLYHTESGWYLSGLTGESEIRVYSNYCPTTKTILPYIYYDFPFKSVSTTEPEWTIFLGEFPVEGEIKLDVRSVDSEGVESDSSSLLELVSPYTDVELPDVVALTGRHVGNGSVELKWFSDALPPFNVTYPMGRWFISTDVSEIALPFEASASINNQYIEWTVVINDPPLTSSSETFEVKSMDLLGNNFGIPSSIYVDVDTSVPDKIVINKKQGF